MLFAARFGTVDAAAGTGYELNVVAAVVVGGVAVFGGSGTVWGAGLGALLLTVIGSSLAVLDINQFWQQAIVGALIMLAIGADRLVAVRIARGAAEEGLPCLTLTASALAQLGQRHRRCSPSSVLVIASLAGGRTSAPAATSPSWCSTCCRSRWSRCR